MYALAWVLAGFGIGWIASWFFVVRPLMLSVRDMRYEGFVFDRPPSKVKPKQKVLTRNET